MRPYFDCRGRSAKDGRSADYSFISTSVLLFHVLITLLLQCGEPEARRRCQTQRVEAKDATGVERKSVHWSRAKDGESGAHFGTEVSGVLRVGEDKSEKGEMPTSGRAPLPCWFFSSDSIAASEYRSKEGC